MNPALLIIDAEGAPHWTKLKEGRSRVGRGTDNDFLLTGRGVSRHHALFELDAGILTVRDLDSTYGTRVNGSVIRKKRVSMGDFIDIGVFRIVVLPVDAMHTRAHVAKSTQEALQSDKEMEKFEMAETGEFAVGPTSGVQVFMGESRLVESSQNHQLSDGEETIIYGRVGTDEGSDEFPVDVAIVDGWGSDALARVLTAGSEGLIDDTDVGVSPAKMGKYRRALGVLRRLADIAASGQNRRRIFRQGLEMISTVVASQTAVVLEIEASGEYKPLAIRHRESLDKGELPISRTVVARAVKERSVVISENLSSDPKYAVKDSVNMYRVGALLALPIMQKEQVVGVLYFARMAGETFSDFDVNVAHVVSGIASGILRSDRLQKELLSQKQKGSSFDRLIHPTIKERMSTNPANPSVLEPRDLTVMVVRFLDIPEVVKDLEAERLRSLYADYYAMLVEVVSRNGGTLVTTLEDIAVVAFGLPNPARTDAQWAMNGAFELTAYHEKVLKNRVGLKKGICVALDSGDSLWGVVGCPNHLEHVVIGGAKKTAMEISQAYGVHGVVATEATLARVPSPKFDTKHLSIPGTDFPTIYRVLPNRA